MSEAHPLLGLRVTKDEYTIVNQACMAVAKEARARGAEPIYKALKQFGVRLRQAVFVGEGVPDETMAALSSEIEAAFAEANFDRARIAIRAMLAAVIRMDPDPAHVIALVLAPHFMKPFADLDSAGAAVASETMKRFAERLDKERAMFESTKWCSGEEMLAYVRNLSSFCAEELASGRDPFAEPEEGS